MVTPWKPRRRRRRGLWVTTVLTLGLLALIGMGQVRSDTRTLASYLDVTRSIASAESTVATSFQNAVIGLGQMERPTLIATLSELEARVDEGVAALAKTEFPPEAAEANGFLTVAVASWQRGLTEFSEAVLLVVDEPDDATGLARLEEALLDLRVGDRAYGRFRTMASELQQSLDVPGSALPQVAFIPREAGPGVFTASGVADRARSAGSLELRRDVGVAAVTLDPGPVGERDGLRVIPYSERLDLQVSVVNKGNQSERQVEVVLRVETQGVAAFETVSVIEELAPGASKTVTFADVPALVGQRSVLVVEVRPVEGEGETALEDNRVELPIYRNAQE